MSECDILCNFKKCRKVLSGFAYITRCSHAFCEEDGQREIENINFDKKCPACRSPLTKSYDLVKVTLNPTDQFRSMVLAGLRPEIIMDVATRAIMFWSYQVHQEHLHQEVIAKNLRDTLTQVKNDSHVDTAVLKSELQSLRRKVEGLEKDLENEKIKNQGTIEKLAAKSREVQKLQMTCEALRRKQLETVVLQQDIQPSHHNVPTISLGPQTMDSFVNHRAIPTNTRYRRDLAESGSRMHQDEEFVFEPRGAGGRSPHAGDSHFRTRRRI